MNEVHPDNPSYIDGFHYPKFDQRDADRLAECEAVWNTREGPRVGDFVRMPDGEMRRFTYDWGPDHGIQTTWKGEGGSFYFGKGFADYSGSLDPAIPHDKLRDTGEQRLGRFWFFHHNSSSAHNGVHFQVACRVYEVVP